jgi:putative transposase
VTLCAPVVIKTYEQTGKSISHFDLDKLLPILKTEKVFLKETNSQSLQGMTKHVDAAFVRFFREKMDFQTSNLKRTLFSLSLFLNIIQ